MEWKWISVKDRLPISDKHVLCWCACSLLGYDYETYKTGYFNYDEGKWGGEVGQAMRRFEKEKVLLQGKVRVLYWMPLPEPPREG